MIRLKILAAVVALGLAVLPATLLAHHSHASLNRDDVRVMNGVVTRYYWSSPHVYIKANVLNEAGELVEYTMELGNPMAMAEAGWGPDTWKEGDRITWQGSHDRDLNRPYMGLSWAEKEDGFRYSTNASAQLKYLQETGREVPESMIQDRPVTPAIAIGEGTWTRIAEDGGRFRNIYTPEPAMDWPLTDVALEQIANFSEGDNPITECVFNGPPRNILTLSNFQWSRPDEHTVLIDRDLWPEPRIIHLDANAPAGEPSLFGHSVGWFEGDELHVKSSNFTEDSWGLFWGIASSEQKELYEKYWLSEDGMRLNVEITMVDPVMLTQPHVITHQWRKVADQPLVKAPCSVDNANFFLTAGYE